jgi:RNA polymerase subunit RPABC4/transcription elongation factor Spt4
MRCAKCSAELAPGAAFCPVCGTPAAAAAPPAPPTSGSCPKCGSPVPPGAGFCPVCGTPSLAASPSPGYQAAPPPPENQGPPPGYQGPPPGYQAPPGYGQPGYAPPAYGQPGYYPPGPQETFPQMLDRFGKSVTHESTGLLALAVVFCTCAAASLVLWVPLMIPSMILRMFTGRRNR